MSEAIPWIWWIVRSMGLLAYLSLWWSMIFGVMLSGRGAARRVDPATTAELHRRWALFALWTTAIHALLSVWDHASEIPALAIFVPLSSPTLRGPVALGTLALWALGALVATSLWSAKLPRRAWRALHAFAFGAFLLALLHGVTAGSDGGSLPVQAVYIGTAATLVAAVFQRIALALHTP